MDHDLDDEIENKTLNDDPDDHTDAIVLLNQQVSLTQP